MTTTAAATHLPYCTCPDKRDASIAPQCVLPEAQGVPASDPRHLVTAYQDALAAGDKDAAAHFLALVNAR